MVQDPQVRNNFNQFDQFDPFNSCIFVLQLTAHHIKRFCSKQQCKSHSGARVCWPKERTEFHVRPHQGHQIQHQPAFSHFCQCMCCKANLSAPLHYCERCCVVLRATDGFSHSWWIGGSVGDNNGRDCDCMWSVAAEDYKAMRRYCSLAMSSHSGKFISCVEHVC